jgi:hypothetical protein
MIVPVTVAGAGAALPKDRAMRARLKPHLDADPELLTALRIHLELARDDYRPRPRRAIPTPRTATLRRADHQPGCCPDDSSPAA